MIINKLKQEKYVKELRERFASLTYVLEGRQATHDDLFHSCNRWQYTAETLERSLIIDSFKLQMAVDDFATILKAIKSLK
jgi:hypothetical protein